MKKKNIKSNTRKPQQYVILFICSGNLCRSPMAKGLMDKIIIDHMPNAKSALKIVALSAGTIAVNGEPPTGHAQQAVRKYGAEISHHLSAPLTEERINMADLILTMQEKHKTAVLTLVPTAKIKTFIITEYANKDKQGIADPIGQPLEKYEETADKLYLILQKVYNKIMKKK
jgi:protein-tyrosine-phosphatase